MSFSTKGLLSLILFGVALAITAGALVSDHIFTSFANTLKEREIRGTLQAIEAGPVALARVQAGAIAQEFLNKLMLERAADHQLFDSASIRGGHLAEYQYAGWQSAHPAEAQCLKEIRREFTYTDALNPFVVSINVNSCYHWPVEVALRSTSMTTNFVAIFLVVLIILVSFVPLTISIARARTTLADSSGSERLSRIWYTPIRELVRLANRAAALEAEAAFSRLAKQVAHDIRSPLSALSLAIDSANGSETDRRQLIQLAAGRIRKIADDLVSRAKAPRAAPFDLQRAIADIVSEKRALLPDSISLAVELTQDSLQAMGDAVEFERVLSNLINNAAEAMSQGGSITLKSFIEGATAKIEISDTGVGMAPDLLAQLGTEGFSVGKAGSDAGTGLGVAHGMRTLQAWGGSMVYVSEPGRGTRVTLTLRLPAAAQN